MSSLPSVAIVILNWNGKQFLQQFLPSVLATTYGNCRVIIADNSSTDNSVIFLKENFPGVEVISLSQNFGFAKGYNEALKQVNCEYYVLLNSDVEVKQDWLEPIISMMEGTKLISACQPKILSYHSKSQFEYAGAAGGWIDSFGYPFSRGRIFDVCEEDQAQYDSIQKIFWASGAAMVVRSKLFHQMGGFDEYFFAHQEEIDLCWRMQLAGYKIYSCPQSIVYHVGGGTLPKGNSRKTFLNFRNNQIMLAKNLPLSEKWWKIPFRLMLDQLTAWKGLLSGDVGYFAAIIKAHLAFVYWIFFGKKKKFIYSKKKLNKLDGAYNGNIAWQHFYKKKNFFSEIIKAKE